MTAADETSKTMQVYRIYIKASPEAIWEALTKPEWTVKYGYAGLVEYDLRPGGRFRVHANEGMKAFPGIPDIVSEGEVIEANPPRKLVHTWRMQMSSEMA
ncbi:MAG TPA: SRPBCC domain-containing protein, partial [Chloroflexota bacterium]|nr:SRPBCC domain-containing protein [Chloroflexota bacterium]